MCIFICIFFFFFFFSSRRRHTRLVSDWSSDVCSSDLSEGKTAPARVFIKKRLRDITVVEVMIREGMNREVRRVFAKFGRSEERRVGKECRSRWSRYH